MRYTDFSNLGGFIWWLLIKFKQTKLKDEQSNHNWARNIFVVLFFGVIIGFIIHKLF